MLSTRSLPPQFLLPAWSSRQLAQAVQKPYSTDNSNESYSKPSPQLTDSGVRGSRRALKNSRSRSTALDKERAKRPANRVRYIRKTSLTGSRIETELSPVVRRVWIHNFTPTQDFELPAALVKPRNKLVISRIITPDAQEKKTPHPRPVPLERGLRAGKAAKFDSSTEAVKSLKAIKKKEMLQENPPTEPLSLFEELFPEEALAREKRKKRALERLEKLPAFNWTSDNQASIDYETNKAKERARAKQAFTSIPARPISPEKAKLSSGKKDAYTQPQKLDVYGNKKFAVLVLQGCSKTLEVTDIYRIGSKGNHVESWTRGIVKVIPARDNVTLKPLGEYYILFSNKPAAWAYLDQTLQLLEFARAKEFTRIRQAHHFGEEQDAMLESFSMVPTTGLLSLRHLEPPYSKGLQWMLNAGGPAALVAKQSKAQDIVLFTTDRDSVAQADLLRALGEDGVRRNLHWRLAGDSSEAITKLETNILAQRAEGGTRFEGRLHGGYRGPARYIISFKDSNEARRFVREWHQRPFPTNSMERHEQLVDEPPAIVNAEVLW
ncbi:hypothetical protein QTJ16_000455 [Diplocarpon rosae]|uniref:Uncharacterized protein n=1 Tax=Diplocarpon rosae TaxID=946125 RepID=A0AAD9T5C5_9HELO|nr:hypothetical protein QTJ16_000455 [Diplocarpon rosae]